MTDELEEFEALLKKSVTPEPDEKARKEAIFRAMAAFDEKTSRSRQGISLPARLMDAVRAIHNTLFGAEHMKKAYILAGVSVLTLAILYSGHYSEFYPQQQAGNEEAGANQAIKERVVSANAHNQGELTIAPGSLPVPPAESAAPKEKSADMASAATKESFADDNKGLNTLAASPGAQPVPPAVLSSSQPVPASPEMPRREFAQKAEMDSALKTEPTRAKDMESNMALQRNGAPGVQNMEMNEKKAAGMAQSELSIAPGSLPSPAPNIIGGITGGKADDVYMPYQQPYTYHDESRDKFEHIAPSPNKQVATEPVSTFSVDVDTSSYSFMRSSLNNGSLPQPDAVRIEELINYFPYEYEAPKDKKEPFKSTVSVFPTPWNPDTKLMHIGIKGYDIPRTEKPRSNLVFLLDTSGSMNDPVRLPLVVNSMKLLLDSLKPDDTVAIVTYAGYSGVALPPTKVADKSKILSILNNMYAEGSTAGYEGLSTAYQLAEQNFDPKSVNRVILATDGDFNVGTTDQDELKHFIERERDKGIFLSILGVGRGNYNDSLMQTLAQNGNGVAAYIDNLNEARKVLVEEAGSTLFTIAKDVKIQVEFNPAKIAEYRLIGYENRMLKREDFNNDRVDAGDIGSGHAVTAIYEIIPVGSKSRQTDDLRYQKPAPAPALSKESDSGEYAFVKIRYKLPDSSTSKLISTPVDSHNEAKQSSEAPQEARFAAAVAAFGQLLKGDTNVGSFSYDDVIALARAARGPDTFGYRAEFINLVELAKHDARPYSPEKSE